MFNKITLKNYRTHKSTSLELKPVTLLIGNNNSGKTNLLAGIQHFCGLIRRGHHLRKETDITVEHGDYFSHRYRLAKDDEPMSISIEWTNSTERPPFAPGKKPIPPGKITYTMSLYEPEKSSHFQVGCKEQITVELAKKGKPSTVKNGYDKPTNLIALRRKIENSSSLQETEKDLCRLFFYGFANTFSYHLQPSFLKGKAKNSDQNSSDQLYGDDNIENNSDDVRIPPRLGYEGNNLQEVLLHTKHNDEHTFSRFTALMRRFEKSFHGVRDDERGSGSIWEFDLGRQQLIDELSADVISNGLLKAAAISLLISLPNPSALIMLEEIENGINPGNIQGLMDWIWQAAFYERQGYTPQFIITSHSPAVLREFHNRLNHVYTVHLAKRRFQSDVRNLNDSLNTFVGIGTVEGDIDEESGLVNIPKYQLAELWYSGAIG